MSKTYFPFDAGAGAGVTEAQWYQMARKWLGSGVLSGELDELEAYADSSGMQVKVKAGQAWIEGHFFKSDAEETLAIAAADASNPRIDRVVVRLDRVNNTIDLVVLTGTAAASPSAPTLTQNSSVWEIPLAQVSVSAGATIITAGNVTDERVFALGVSPVGYAAHTTMVYLDPAYSTTRLLDIIDSTPHFIPAGHRLRFVWGTGTHVATDAVRFAGFWGGGVLEIAAEVPVSLAGTGQTSIIDVSSSSAYWFEVSDNACRITVDSLRIVSGDESYGVRLLNNSGLLAMTNCYSQHGGQTVYGMAVQVSGGQTYFSGLYVSDATVGVRADYYAVCYLLNCASVGTLPANGVVAHGAWVHRGGSVITGSSADAVATAGYGGEIT